MKNQNLKSILLLIIASFWIYTFCQSSIESTVLKDVAIIHPQWGLVQKGMSVLIQGEKIAKIEKTARIQIPNNSIVIDLSDKYLIPGLWDMHVHTCWKSGLDTTFLPLFLANGVTGIRDLGGKLDLLNLYKRKIQDDPALGPDLYGCGPILDGNPPADYEVTIPLDNEKQAIQVVDSLRNAGADFIKVYSLLRPNVYQAIAEHCKKLDLPFSGHVSEFVTPFDASRAGQRSLEHLNRIEDFCINKKETCDSLIQTLKENNTWVCPTLVLYDYKAYCYEQRILHKENLKYIEDSIVQRWEESRTNRVDRIKNEEEWKTLQKRYENQINVVTQLYRSGINILTGTDVAGTPYVLPGFSIHDELSLLVKAGLSEYEALKCATFNPAKYLAIDDLHGSIESGKIANLVVLDENPIDNIENTMKIFGVVRKGKFLDRKYLEDLLRMVNAEIKLAS